MWQKPRVLAVSLVAGPFVALALSVSCVDSPTEITTPTTTLAACELNNTAKISFENRSTSNRTYDVIWDGSKRTILGPGERSDQYTEQAGVTHSLQFKFTNSGQAACSLSHPILVVCTSSTYWCTS